MNQDISKKKYTDKKLTYWAKRVRKLEDSKIDRLWYSMGWISLDKENEMESLRKIDIVNIKKSPKKAKQIISYLLSESSMDDFDKKLSKIEKSQN